ncbi:hypothetical protein VTJ49DRAFT_6653 [Mycothermus thermophilus]|uniref:Pisatin demethylase n=1 Tax=Humicola insolens TaxID=85995 RepID=A0ABR3VIP0_HUMIN
MPQLTLPINLDLTPGGWALVVSTTTLLAYILSSLLAWYRLRHFPGPFLASFSHLWLARAFWSGRACETFVEAEARHGGGGRRPPRTPGTGLGVGTGVMFDGSTIRIGPNELMTSDVEVIRRASAARGGYGRSRWYKMSSPDPHHEGMFSTLDGAVHDRLKAQTAAGYAGRDNPFLEKDMDYVVGILVEKIKTKYAVRGGEEEGERSKPFLDLATITQYFTLDSIAKLAFGEEFGLVREERDIHGHLAMLHEVTPVLTTVAAVPLLRDIMGSKLVLRLFGPKPTDKKGLGRLMGTGIPIVAKRFAPGAPEKQDMLGSFMRHGMTQKECEVEALMQIVAGSDTTATAIRCALLFLMSAPRTCLALQAEIDEGIRAGRISSPITNAEANDLPYLQAVIYETLRLHPPFAGVPFKVVPPGGDTIDGKHVPGGTLIAPNFWTTGRNVTVFGPDADVFRPERWLSVEEEERAEMRRVAELAFGYGRWGCAGKMIAFLELNKVLVELVRRFDMQLVYPWNPWKSVNHNLFLQSDMWVRVAMREAGSWSPNPVPELVVPAEWCGGAAEADSETVALDFVRFAICSSEIGSIAV